MYVHVTVTPNAKKEEVVEVKELYFTVKVKEPAKENRANTRVREIIAEHFGVVVEGVRIVNGHHHPKKLISVSL
ncbi:MAG: DUF167 domain-containing protein [Parcubacteria group bacterium]|nr:DUF167 domain-containing protein [Parcubacteria group bacterium]